MDSLCRGFSSLRDFSPQDVMLVLALHGAELIRKLVSQMGDYADTCRLRNLAAVGEQLHHSLHKSYLYRTCVIAFSMWSLLETSSAVAALIVAFCPPSSFPRLIAPGPNFPLVNYLRHNEHSARLCSGGGEGGQNQNHLPQGLSVDRRRRRRRSR